MSEDHDAPISGSKADTAGLETGETPEDTRSTSEDRPVEAAEDSLLAERDEAVDRMKRIQAEFENYQKRMSKERGEWESRAVASFATGLLPLLDDFERALEASRATDAETGLFQGVEMIHGQFVRHLESLGVQAIDAMGQPFDPAFHEAVAQQPSADHPDKTVLQEARRGYTLGDRVLRPAQVLISRSPSDEDTH